MRADLEEVCRQVASSKLYAHLSEDLIRRICGEELQKHPRPKDAVKAAKHRLHLIYGAFFPTQCHKQADALLERWTEDSEEQRGLCREILSLHPSSRERLPWMEEFYHTLFVWTGPVQSVLDLGCGFHPFSLPWMEPWLEPGSEYRALDLDRRTVSLLNRFFQRAGLPELAVQADAASYVGEQPADVAFLCKLAPVLEQQRKGMTRQLVERLPARQFAVTFPTRSLSGKRRGMERFYGDWFQNNLSNLFRRTEITVVGDELLCLGEK